MDSFKRLWPEIRQQYAEQLLSLAWEALMRFIPNSDACTNEFSIDGSKHSCETTKRPAGWPRCPALVS
ncbi:MULTISPECIES: hypothetical protein [Hydrocarboniphaga]|uniref:hypothetical protein n=1 Tax=Hydrocarboniphaga TaxID=243627 RepID=UPI001ED96FC1|nr:MULTISPECIES: hypothetical protein [Hydrocarboniphaga]